MTDPNLHDPGPAEAFPEGSPGAIKRPAPFWKEGPVPPFAATVMITSLAIRGDPGMQFEIIANWTGPHLPGTPTPQPGQKVNASDCYVVDRDRFLAQAIAGRALEQLRAGVIPDLRALAVELRKRAE
ncbi:MAG TPA: hypothetical protein VG348_15840 [Acidimicrobiia bacterium]|jgi:hypothetical protein|nr:hypothetical protein [Acidimicrobiia bacterium]